MNPFEKSKADNDKGMKEGSKMDMKMDAKQKHPGFKAVAQSIERKEGVSAQDAGAMLAASTRKSSAKAKKANPNLKRVK